MSDFPDATRAVNEVLGPGDVGTYAGTATPSTAVAANLDLGGGVATAFAGAYRVSFQARGGDIFVRFKSTATAAGTTATNASNGYKIADGQIFTKWVTANERYCDHIASVAATLFWYQSSPNYRVRA